MKKILLSILMIISIVSYTQERCGTKLYTDLLKEKYPEYKAAREKVNLETYDNRINVSDLASGIYLIKVKSQALRFVKE